MWDKCKVKAYKIKNDVIFCDLFAFLLLCLTIYVLICTRFAGNKGPHDT